MTPRRIGDAQVSSIGLGGASWSFDDYPAEGGSRSPQDADDLGVRTIHAALDSGITFIDTAHAYTTSDQPGQSEALIARALRDHPAGPGVLVATKGGFAREGNDFPVDARRDVVRRQCEASCRLLSVDRIDLYQLHLPDPEIPMAKAMAAFAELRDEGVVRDVGVCNVSVAQLEEAMSVVPIVSVQNAFSPFHQDDRAMLDHCASHAIAYLAHSPLGGGPQPRMGRAGGLAESFPAAAAVAARRQMSVYRLTLAWLLRLSDTVIPICGAGRPRTIQDSAQAMDTVLSAEELAELDF